MKSHKVLYVNPVARQSVQGRDRQTYQVSLTTGDLIQTKSMQKTKEFGVGSELTFPSNFRKNRLETGLDSMVDNPFTVETVEELKTMYSLSSHWSTERLKELLESAKIKKQTYYEIMADVKEGTYTTEKGPSIFTHRDLKNAPKASFLEKFKVVLYDRPNKFTSETPRGRLCLSLIENHPKIAKSRAAINSAVHLFYISEENEAEMEYNKKQDIINRAIYNLYKLHEEFSTFENLMVASLLTNHQNKVLIKGEVNSSTVKKALSKYINSKTSSQMENIGKFMGIVKLLDSREGKEEMHLKFLIQQAINKRVIVISDGYYVWHSRKESPNVYKFSQYDKLLKLMKNQFETYNPDDEDLTNWYGELLQETKAKGANIEVI